MGGNQAILLGKVIPLGMFAKYRWVTSSPLGETASINPLGLVTAAKVNQIERAQQGWPRHPFRDVGNGVFILSERIGST